MRRARGALQSNHSTVIPIIRVRSSAHSYIDIAFLRVGRARAGSVLWMWLCATAATGTWRGVERSGAGQPTASSVIIGYGIIRCVCNWRAYAHGVRSGVCVCLFVHKCKEKYNVFCCCCCARLVDVGNRPMRRCRALRTGAMMHGLCVCGGAGCV